MPTTTHLWRDEAEGARRAVASRDLQVSVEDQDKGRMYPGGKTGATPEMHKKGKGRVMPPPDRIHPKPIGKELASAAGSNELCKQVSEQVSVARLLCLELWRIQERGGAGATGQEAKAFRGQSSLQELLGGVATAPAKQA